MIDTTDLSSYYPGYDDYCEPKEYKDPDDDPTVDERVDERVDEMILERLEKEESEKNGLH